MFRVARVCFVLCILSLCTTYFSDAGGVTWIQHFQGNVTRYRRQANCGPPFFICKNGQCIPEDIECDGDYDCNDGSDEANCPGKPPITSPTVIESRTPPSTQPPSSGRCLLPNHPANGEFTVGGMGATIYKPGDYAPPFSALIITCKSKYEQSPPEDGSFPFCVGGKWSRLPPTCTRFCQSIKTTTATKAICIYNGIILDSCENPLEGTVAVLSCEPRHQEPGLLQNPSRICKDGSWDYPISECFPEQASRCDTAATVINGGKTTCLNQVIIDDQFNGPVVNSTTWIEEHFIPTYSEPNFEFNSYESKDDTRFFKNGMLYLKPIPKNEDEVKGILNFRNGCTSSQASKCYHEHKSSFLLPPVKSARITSQTSFRYGKVEIRAKLPAGDWIFPIIQLEPKLDEGDNSAKVWIAYSRGNNYLFGADPTVIDVRGTGRDDIGSRLFFVGPVLHPTEPGRSKKLVSERSSTNPYNADFHVYTLNWVPGRMTFFIDSREVGSVDLRNSFADPSLLIGDKWNTPEAPFDREYVLSLGVGVGGINDFPDGYTSGNNIQKPWVNRDRNYVKTFFEAKNIWSRTWNGDNSALQIDYVKVTAV